MPHADPERGREWRRGYYALHAEMMRLRSKERKRRYGRPCLDCGTLTDGSNGSAKAPLRCAACTPAFRKVWTQDAVIAAIQLFAERYGAPPSATDWNPTMARKNGRDDWASRFYSDGDYPQVSIVIREFGSWNAGIAAAGFTPRAPGMRGPDRERVA